MGRIHKKRKCQKRNEMRNAGQRAKNKSKWETRRTPLAHDERRMRNVFVDLWWMGRRAGLSMSFPFAIRYRQNDIINVLLLFKVVFKPKHVVYVNDFLFSGCFLFPQFVLVFIFRFFCFLLLFLSFYYLFYYSMHKSLWLARTHRDLIIRVRRVCVCWIRRMRSQRFLSNAVNSKTCTHRAHRVHRDAFSGLCFISFLDFVEK